MKGIVGIRPISMQRFRAQVLADRAGFVDADELGHGGLSFGQGEAGCAMQDFAQQALAHRDFVGVAVERLGVGEGGVGCLGE
jgi:hypothetical protein